MSRLSEQSQFRVWKDIASALDYLHSQDILHLDIKPQNILLRGHERAVLCDFELAHAGVIKCIPRGPPKYDVVVPSRFLAGTPSYIPPEMLLYTERGAPGDIWAFGVTLLFVFGQIPLPREGWIIAKIYTDATTQEAMSTWLKLILSVVSNLPKRLSLLRQMLKENPNKRITASPLSTRVQKGLAYRHFSLFLS